MLELNYLWSRRVAHFPSIMCVLSSLFGILNLCDADGGSSVDGVDGAHGVNEHISESTNIGVKVSSRHSSQGDRWRRRRFFSTFLWLSPLGVRVCVLDFFLLDFRGKRKNYGAIPRWINFFFWFFSEHGDDFYVMLKRKILFCLVHITYT